ncbi:MAG TPA: hypothetical protein VGE20_02605 [Ramlibacter sp.]
MLADYAVALVAERESWGRLHEPDLTEAERCRILGEWKQVSAGLKTLVRQLRDVPADSIFEPARSHCTDAGSDLPPEAADDWEVMADAAPVPGASAAAARRRPFHVHCLLASLRLVTTLRARLGSAVPRLGPL